MTQPVSTVRIDWEGAGTFTAVPAIDTPSLPPKFVNCRRGASSDFSGESTGSARIVLRNDNHEYTKDRNWTPNPSFENGTAGWYTPAIASLTAAGTSISQVADVATGSGSKAGEVVLTATNNSGAYHPIPFRLLNGLQYSGQAWLKSISGNLNVRFGVASSGTPANIGSTSSNITSSWASYPFTFTPTADRDDAVFFLRTITAAAATVRVDAIQFNPGSTLNDYIEAPTRTQLVRGKAIQVYATYSATTYGKFFGYIDRIEADHLQKTVTITAKDPLAWLADIDVVVPVYALSRSAREWQIAVLEDAYRGNRNLVGHNPSFETDTAGWNQSGTSLARITTSFATAGGGTASGQFVASGAGQRAYIYARLAPRAFANQVYRWSVYLQRVSGATSWRIGVGPDVTGTDLAVSTTTSFARYTTTTTLAADIVGGLLIGWVESTGAGTINIDCAAITRGQAYYPYSDTGAGRWPNMAGNVSFDSQVGTQPEGWFEPFINLVTNGNFTTDTSGWSVAGDSFHSAATSITQFGSGGLYGPGRADIVTSAGGQGAHFAVTGTEKASNTYDLGIVVKKSTGTANATVGAGSNGTATDKSEVTQAINTGYSVFVLTWDPSSNRSDGHFYIKFDAAGTYSIDGAYLIPRPRDSTNAIGFVESGPGGGGQLLIQAPTVTAFGLFGGGSLKAQSTGSGSRGAIYDLWQEGHNEAYFVGGQDYSIQITASGIGDYKVGIAARAADGTYDEVSTTGTAVGKTTISVPWTPSRDYSSTQAWQIIAFAYRTDGSSGDITIGGLRIIPGSVADDFEMDEWNIAAGANVTDLYLATASISGKALSVLQQLNALSLTRMWSEPTSAAPWYQVHTEDRDTFKAKSSVATISGAAIGSATFAIDSQATVNTVGVKWAGGGIEYYGDPDSTGDQGVKSATVPVIDGSAWFADRTIPDQVGPALVDRYRNGAIRPEIHRTNLFTQQLVVDVEDVITLTEASALVQSQPYVVLAEDLTIVPGADGEQWDTTWSTESYPY